MKRADAKAETVVEFLPDADEIERSPLPREARITVPILMAALVAFLLWATFSRVDRVVVAHGHLATVTPNIVVQPLDTSIIKSIDVRVGQVVKKGQRLATLDPTFAEADAADLQTRLSSLDTQETRLKDELAGGKFADKAGSSADSQLQVQLAAERRATYEAQLAKMEENVARLNASMETNLKDQQALEDRLAPLREIEAMQEKLVEKQYGPRINLLQARDRRLDVERSLQLARSQEQEIARQLEEAKSEKEAFEREWRQKAMEEMLTTSRELDSVKEQLQKADKRNQLVELDSPSDAVVLEIAKLSQGSIARGTEPLFTLVPLGAKLEAEVQIDSTDVGNIKVGDKVEVKLDAFPFQQYGALTGKVRTISEDSFKRDASATHGLDSYYQGRIDLGDSHLKNMTDRSKLLPGMTLSAEILVGKRSVMSYLLWPLTKTMDESLREP